jgi:hypothetical protein
MPEPSPHPRIITLGIDRPADLLMAARSLGLAIRRPAWHTNSLRARLHFLLRWAENQPVTGPPDSGGTDLDGDRWVHRYPTIPRSHPLHDYIEALGHKIRKALTRLDQEVLKDATQIYDEVLSVIEQISTRLAEPDATRGPKLLKGTSIAGQLRSARYEPFREQVCAEAQVIRTHHPNLSTYSMAEQIHRNLKPARLKPDDDKDYLPSVDTIRQWIPPLKPPRKNSK